MDYGITIRTQIPFAEAGRPAGRPCVQSRIGIGPSLPLIRGELECYLAGQAWARQAASPGRGRMGQRDAI